MSSHEVQICIECGKETTHKDNICPGEALISALAPLLKEKPATNNTILRSVACLGNCDHGCRVVLASHLRWSWALGDIDPEFDAKFIMGVIEQWLDVPTGLIPKKERSEKLIDKTLSRHPPLT